MVAVPIATNNAAAIATALAGRSGRGRERDQRQLDADARGGERGSFTYLAARAMDPYVSESEVHRAGDGRSARTARRAASSSADDGPGAIAAVTAAATAGFPTFVVGIATGGSTADTTLNGDGVSRAATRRWAQRRSITG